MYKLLIFLTLIGALDTNINPKGMGISNMNRLFTEYHPNLSAFDIYVLKASESAILFKIYSVYVAVLKFRANSYKVALTDSITAIDYNMNTNKLLLCLSFLTLQQ